MRARPIARWSRTTLFRIEGQGVDPDEIRRMFTEDDPQKVEQRLVVANESFVTEPPPNTARFCSRWLLGPIRRRSSTAPPGRTAPALQRRSPS